MDKAPLPLGLSFLFSRALLTLTFQCTKKMGFRVLLLLFTWCPSHRARPDPQPS